MGWAPGLLLEPEAGGMMGVGALKVFALLVAAGEISMAGAAGAGGVIAVADGRVSGVASNDKLAGATEWLVDAMIASLATAGAALLRSRLLLGVGAVVIGAGGLLAEAAGLLAAWEVF